jgi:hypothetical protein
MLRAPSVSVATKGAVAASAAFRKSSIAAAAMTTTTTNHFFPISTSSSHVDRQRNTLRLFSGTSTAPNVSPWKSSLMQNHAQHDTFQRRFLSSGPPGGGPQNLGSIFGTGPQSGSFLQDFTVDLTELARKQDEKQSMDPIIGRHEEIRRCLQILARRTKNNREFVKDKTTCILVYIVSSLLSCCCYSRLDRSSRSRQDSDRRGLGAADCEWPSAGEYEKQASVESGCVLSSIGHVYARTV